MKRKFTILGMLILTVLIGLPLDGFGASNKATETVLNNGSVPQIRVSIGQPRRRRMRRGGYWRDGVFYRNYGQYRRTQVGYRRYRMVPRYYWDDGRRYTRWVRVYY